VPRAFVYKPHSSLTNTEKDFSVEIMESTLTILSIIVLSLYVFSMKRVDLIEQRQIIQSEVAFLAEGEAISNLDELYAVEYEDLEDEAVIDTVMVSMRGGGDFQFRRSLAIDCVAYSEITHGWVTVGCDNPSFKRATVAIEGPLNLGSQFSIEGTVRLDRIYPRDRYLGESDDD